MIREVEQSDIPAIMEIYNHYVQNSASTFEAELVTLPQLEERILRIKSSYPYFVYLENDQVVGYAYADLFRTRVAYRFSCESSVYIHKDHYRKGIAKALYQRLLTELQKGEYKSVVGVITLPNQPSVRLHEEFGYKNVGTFQSAGRKFGEWHDAGFWQLML